MPKFKVEVKIETTEYWIVEADSKKEAEIYYVPQGDKIDEKRNVHTVIASEELN